MKAFIRLFKAVPITKKGKKDPSKKLLQETIKRGFIFSPEVASNYSEDQLLKLIPIIESVFGIDGSKLNNTFHKSWRKVRDANIMTLVLEQMIHYMTTYGFEKLGIYDKDQVFIPSEELKIPKIKLDKISLVVIKGYTLEEFKEKLFNLLKSGIALSEDTRDDVVEIVTSIGIEKKEIFELKNKEVRIILYEYLDIIPENPIEFLRYVLYRSIQKTLLIKDNATVALIKASKNISVLKLFQTYEKEHGLEKLAKIFYRFKPLFLAFRTNIGLKKIINKIRRLAPKHHEPMGVDFLNNVTNYIKQDNLDLKVFEKELDKVNVFRKVRLAYALKFRTCDPDHIMYRIRNGKSYVSDFEKQNLKDYEKPLKIILKSIANDIKEKVDGKKIYIPKGIEYTLPATEKQFVGNFPSGTCITVPNNIIFGIHWTNINHHRIDLDLSLINCDGHKMGWNGYYRNDKRTILFSGDMTDAPAPKGATELFYVKSNEEWNGILYVNYYNYAESVPVPFKIVVGRDTLTSLPRNYMINPNNLIAVDTTSVKACRQKVLGLVVSTKKECKFYYIETSLGDSITSRVTPTTMKARQFLFDFYFGSISLNEMLEIAGAELVGSKEDCDIDLSPEVLEKDTIINLIN